jgi:hypothetical protein
VQTLCELKLRAWKVDRRATLRFTTHVAWLANDENYCVRIPRCGNRAAKLCCAGIERPRSALVNNMGAVRHCASNSFEHTHCI